MLTRVPLQTGMKDYSPIKAKMDADWLSNQSIWQMHQAEASIDTRLEAGDVSLMAALTDNLPLNSRNNFYFNRVRPLCSQVSGYQRNNRKKPVVIPLQYGDQKTADQWTKILMNIWRSEHADSKVSDSFLQGGIITGLNLLQIYLDFDTDPVFGDIRIANLPYNNFFIDPFFKEADLSDCRFIWRRSIITHAAAAMAYPDYYEEIMQLPGNPPGIAPDSKFNYLPEAYGQALQNNLTYDEYWYRDYVDCTRIVDTRTGLFRDITEVEQVTDVKRLLAENPSLTKHRARIPTVRMAVQIQDKVFYDGPNPLGIHNFPFIPTIGYYNPGMPYFYTKFSGLCRSLRDPQMLLNRRIILNMDIAESIPNTGWIFAEDSIVDVKHLFQTGPGRMIPIKKGHSIQEIQPMPSIQVPDSYFELANVMGKEFSLVSGINDELMGFNADDKSGYSRALQQGAGLTTLQPLFDRLDDTVKTLGTRLMEVVRACYGPAKIAAMLEGEKPEPLFFNQAFGKYHCAVELGFNTETQQQMQFAQLLKLQEVGVPLPPNALLKAATIQNKSDIIEEVQQQMQQQQQAQQRQAEIQQQQVAAQTQWYHARAEADLGTANERNSRVPENRALAIERIAEANKDNEIASLNKIKAAKELEEMDLRHLAQLIEMVDRVKAMEMAETQPLQEEGSLASRLKQPQGLAFNAQSA